VVLACAGDIPTLETVAAAWWLRQHLPALKVRVVNVVDLMTLYPTYLHPHGMDTATFVEHFTEDRPVVFAFHGYPRAVHELVHGRPNEQRFHVRGFHEEGTTTTPFDMVVLNGMSRYHLCIEAMRRATRLQELTPPLIAECDALLNRHHAYIREHFEDLPEVRDWVWSDTSEHQSQSN
jgi:xylulose-5-phosphate/fructose-6-phosphate phosphoketolase